jgi:trans-2,3-dihydro-3-hydroxyanthranilate isomerase
MSPIGPTLSYVVVDVFAERAFAGNPLAIVLGGEDLATDQMQRIAREFNLSETTFPLHPTGDQRAAGADYHLRIFTPDTELPFAGHPSVGTAWWLAQAGWFSPGPVGQLCGEGLLPVEVTTTGAVLTGGAARVGEVEPPEVALAAVSLGAEALAGRPVRISSTGLAYAVLFVTPESLARCVPDVAVLRREFAYPTEATGVYVVAWDPSARHARARMFAGDIGSPEDAATGSAALALGAVLAADGEFPDGTSTFTVEQGVDMGRPSLLTVTCTVRDGRVERLQVGGQVALVARGEIAAPPP